MSISIYKTLLESYEFDNLKQYMKSNLEKFQNLVIEYINLADESDFLSILGEMLVPLNNIIKKFNELGFTYEPDTTTDVDEDNFTTILDRYSDQVEDFISDFSRDKFESFNVQTRDIFSLIDLHRTRYIKEGEILIDNLN